jgi:hypothetical protein
LSKQVGLAFGLTALATAGTAPAAAQGVDGGANIVFVSKEVVQPLPQETRILSERDARRLRSAQGITLQWVSWEASERGRVAIGPGDAGIWRLSGSQIDQSGAGLRIDGTITEIGKDYFLFDGRVQIADTPDAGRSCDASKVWRFEVTQNRSYYRLREFEWCDGLTDYVDIYFAPRLR